MADQRRTSRSSTFRHSSRRFISPLVCWAPVRGSGPRVTSKGTTYGRWWAVAAIALSIPGAEIRPVEPAPLLTALDNNRRDFPSYRSIIVRVDYGSYVFADSYSQSLDRPSTYGLPLNRSNDSLRPSGGSSTYNFGQNIFGIRMQSNCAGRRGVPMLRFAAEAACVGIGNPCVRKSDIATNVSPPKISVNKQAIWSEFYKFLIQFVKVSVYRDHFISPTLYELIQSGRCREYFASNCSRIKEGSAVIIGRRSWSAFDEKDHVIGDGGDFAGMISGSQIDSQVYSAAVNGNNQKVSRNSGNKKSSAPQFNPDDWDNKRCYDWKELKSILGRNAKEVSDDLTGTLDAVSYVWSN
jgi:hypothetical protein